MDGGGGGRGPVIAFGDSRALNRGLWLKSVLSLILLHSDECWVVFLPSPPPPPPPSSPPPGVSERIGQDQRRSMLRGSLKSLIGEESMILELGVFEWCTGYLPPRKSKKGYKNTGFDKFVASTCRLSGVSCRCKRHP